MSKSYARVFTSAALKLNIDLNGLSFDPKKALLEGSHVTIAEHANEFGVGQQGTGSQRALFWSMLEVRSAMHTAMEAKKGKDKRRAEIEKALKTLSA